MHTSLKEINQGIIVCTKCSRLASYIREVAKKKVRRFNDWDYWGWPVPSFGDPNARVLIIGLAPAAHGANRTGRMFTGDSSGDWLYRALYETSFANQPTSTSRNDGLTLQDVYITAMNHCAPPGNKPSLDERNNCQPYLESEWEIMKDQLKVVLCLGGMAFTRFTKMIGVRGLTFGHHQIYPIANQINLVTSYHPSRQNTNTGRLLWEDWLGVFRELRQMVDKK